jgi:hypothetical protein
VLGFQDLFLSPAGAVALLPPQLGDALRRGAGHPAQLTLDLVGQQLPCTKPVHRLRAFLLTLHHRPARPMHKDHAGCHLVHVLPTFSPRAHEALVKVRFANTQRQQALAQGALGGGGHREHVSEYCTPAPARNPGVARTAAGSSDLRPIGDQP